MKALFQAVLAILVLHAATGAKAVDFSQADVLFKKRSEGVEATESARAAYESLVGAAAGAELVYAVSQIARLDIYQGEMLLPDASREERRRIFRRCYEDTAQRIKPELVGGTPQYYFFAGTCLAFWAEVASPIERLTRVAELKRLIAGGLALDARYYGGGIRRVASAVYANPMARAVGLYNPEESLRLVDEAISAEAYPGDPHPGASYYSNHKYRTRALRELGRTTEAIEFANASLREIEELVAQGALPEGLEPETKFEMRELRELIEQMSHRL